MAIIQIKRTSELAKITAAQLKAGELAVVLGTGADAGKLYVGVDGVAGTAIPVKASGADIANKLANAQNFSIEGDVTATPVAFDGTGAVALQAVIANKAVTKAKLADEVTASLAKADSAVQEVITGETNGTISVDGTDVAVFGLGDAAYKTAQYFEDDAQTKADAVKNAVVNTITAGNGVAVTGTATEKTVAVVVDPTSDEHLTVGADGLKLTLPAADEYTVVKDADAGEFSAVYHLTKNGANVGAAINIPKDLFVKSGEVVVNPEGQPAGTYIKLTLQNQEAPLYINVATLIDAYTGVDGDEITVAVSEDNKISAVIKDGTIALGKLAQGVQDSIAKADTALQKADIAEGTTNGTIAVKGTDVAVHGLKDAAYSTVADLNKHADDAVDALKGTDADATTAITVYGARALAQKGVDDAASAKAEADKKVASVTAEDKSIVVGGTATAPTVKVGVSTTAGNALTLDANGLFVATPSSMAAGNGITIEGNTVSAKVVAANGLSVDASGIKMALGSATTAGAVKGSDEIAIGADGAMTVAVIDAGSLD